MRPQLIPVVSRWSIALLSGLLCSAAAAEPWIVYPAREGPGQGKHVVFLAGDEEYRSEEALPMLAKILSRRHGFKCTVLFSVDDDGTINPYRDFNRFGKRVLGEDWVTHWGRHLQEATRGVIEPSAQGDPLLRGVEEVFGDTDVYEAYPPADARILLRGQVLPPGRPEPAQPQGRAPATPPAPPRLALNPNDHVVLIGNALPDRMQHSGYFEALVHAKFPEHQLVFRNLAVAGDEVVTRHRSANFGAPDEWLTRTAADVILAFFGFNESFQGVGGLEKFKTDLDTFLKETQARNYSGQGAPRIVLFSPIAAERHRDPNFPDPDPLNANLARYVAAMREVARENSVPFVNLFRPSQRLYAQAAEQGHSLTVNGLHLTEAGDSLLAPVLFQALFGEQPPSGNFELLRAAVNEKNRQWHQRYRTVDGYNVYGGRSQLSYESGPDGPRISNYQVMQEEMSQRDLLTANRDRRVWAVAQGNDLEVDDSNLPPVTEVGTNRPGPNPDGSYHFLSGEAALARMTLHPGLTVNLFAGEAEFPDLVNPVQMAWDTRGRLWVAAWLNYPGRTPQSPQGDKLLIFEDTTGDGRADRQTVFLDDLNCPTGFQFYQDGVLLVQAPDVWFVRDTNGDGRGDSKQRILMGLDSADSHHTANSICYGPGGAIYLSDGVFHRTQVETASGPVRNNDGAIFRFEPRTGKFETYIAYGFANPHGRVFDRWGNDLVTDATGNNTYFGPAFSGYLDYPAKHASLRQFWERPARPCAATGILSSRHFPEEFQGNFLNLNVIGFLGIYNVKLIEEGSGLRGETLEHLVHSDDPNFRPSAISIGPDGAIYFADWHNPIIGHMQHHLRDPSRDHHHGRIYRITYEGRPLLTSPRIHDQPVPALLELLKAPENGTRELAKIELGRHDSPTVIAATRAWTGQLDSAHPDYPHHLMEALWVHQWHNVVDTRLLERMLASPEHRARAAATRVLCYWRDRVPSALSLLRTMAADDHPRVRLEAVRAASFFRTAEAADVALAALGHPTDYYLDYTLGETIRQLQPYWRPALAAGYPLAAGNPAGVDYLISRVNTIELLKLPRTAAVDLALLSRPDVPEAFRQEALFSLAIAQEKTGAQVLIETLEDFSGPHPEAPGIFARLLTMQPGPELQPWRARIAQLAARGATAEVRQAAWAALALADDSIDKVWSEAVTSPDALTDLLAGIPLLLDQDLRLAAYDRVMPFLTGAPSPLREALEARSSTAGRFIRIHLPRTGTLTLAEVEAFSGGRNVAPQGRARQSSTAHGGVAARAIDGRTDGEFESGTQTHTRENSRSPWWELDLGGERDLESIVVWNRTDGNLGQRLEGFTLTVLDENRREVFQKTGHPAPAPQAVIEIGTDRVRALRRAAIQAAVSIPRAEAATFNTLAALMEQGEDVPAAAQGLRVLPRASWPSEGAGVAAHALVAWANTIPAAARTAQDYVEAVQTASELAGLLPTTQASALRRELAKLRVDVFVVRAVREQMRFDTPRIVVEAGKPFELVVENPDFMPHNLVVVQPGARPKIGMLADLMKPDQFDSQGRAFVPHSDEILAATRLLEPGQREVLRLTAPEAEGDYEFVCTFPGHWEGMWGWLIVTRDVEAYLRRHPAVLAHPAPAHAHH